MSKTTSRTAETTLSIQGRIDLQYPGTDGADGDGEVEIRVQRRGDSLRVFVSTIVPLELSSDDVIMEFVANVDPSSLPDLLGFEKTIRAMSERGPVVRESTNAHFLRGLAERLEGPGTDESVTARLTEIASMFETDDD